MPKPTTAKYRTTNRSAYNVALKQRGSLEIWFDPDMQWLSTPSGRPCRPMRFSDSEIRVCLTLKLVFRLPLRQVTGLVASLLKLAKLDWPVPDYTTLCRRQKTLAVSLGGRAVQVAYIRCSDLPSHLSFWLDGESSHKKQRGDERWSTTIDGFSRRSVITAQWPSSRNSLPSS